MKIIAWYCPLIVLVFLLSSCNNSEAPDPVAVEEITQKPPVAGSRIAWDRRTLKKISTETGYNGYARVIQLQDRSLLCVYESNGNVVAVKSFDNGLSWSAPMTIASKMNGTNMTVPDVLQLQDNSILVAFNPRPYDIDPSRRFGIRTIKSYDGGQTWQDERLLYEAGYQFENGCWEPAAIQLPGGEIQLFFANEGPFTHSGEQNISLLRSSDGGLTWTAEPETVSFRTGSRDGMPVPLLLEDKNEIIVAIEDNGETTFKPYIIRSSIDNSWSTVVTGNSPRRSYALSNPIDHHNYAGAPYLARLSSGETILSYQGTEGRSTNSLGNADMKVTLGTDEGLNFNRKTTPFIIPENKSCLWNSVSVLEGDTVMALTSTNAYSSNTEVWMIKGHLIQDLAAVQNSINIDGLQNETAWNKHQIFIGHQGAAWLTANITYDDKYLYVLTKVTNNEVANTANIEQGDGVTIYIDPKNQSLEKPDKGIFSIYVSAVNSKAINEGQGGKWSKVNNSTFGVVSSSASSDTRYMQEIAIPWSSLGGKPQLSERIGFNLQLTEKSGGETVYKENISSNRSDEPYTWMTLLLE